MARTLEELLEGKYTKDTYGVWEIRGEDPNCDMGGVHTHPSLGVYEGTYIDICEHALTLKGFFTWGAGGDVYKANENIKSATPIGDGSKKMKRERDIKLLLHDAKEFAKTRLGESIDDDDIIEVKFCDLVKMLKDYEADGK